jgi:hydrogenase/urease accessory protein HupE
VRGALHLALGGWLLLAAPAALAHEARPLHVELTQRGPEVFALEWRVPGSVPDFNRPEVRLPVACTARAGSRRSGDVEHRVFDCPGGLEGGALSIRYPLFNPSVTTLVRFRRLSGERHTAVLGPEQAVWRLPPPETPAGVARTHLELGVAHILDGADHLLFLTCLILVAGNARRIVITVTGFTLAHSLTLVLAALDAVRLPAPPVEAAIALSVVFLATEIARGRRDTWTWRQPIAVSSSFGLLHGFAFAGVLREVGLPQTELPAALLFFNVGVELGQLLFIAALVGAVWLLRHGLAALGPVTADALLARARLPVAYGVGWLASYWLFARIAGF